MHFDPLREILRLRHVLGRLGEPTHGGERRLRDCKPEPARDRDPAQRDQEKEEADPVKRVVDLAQ